TRLEEAGVHVVYGLVNLKTHAKLCLIVRKEADGIRRYAHVATGNYNAATARVFTDLGLVTTRPAIIDDVANVFNYLTGYASALDYATLIVAPVALRRRIHELLEREADHARAGRHGRVIFKLNGLTDPDIIQALYGASQAGVRIDLIVRGICCLRPGVPGLSDNIRVRSIVGRFLEHSRILAFGARDRRRYFIGSADLMPRNLDRRVEAMTPVDDPDLQARLQEILDVNLADDTLAWTLHGDGSWAKVPSDAGVNTHLRLQELAFERARRRRPADAEPAPAPRS
ncbi:MAG TPA: RNA degradosome polyphosphate kinase, partial [Acidimicrobiales bacterium]|nr:RNA degradosome polyphosphate kinase [Acidimicrobiales bacterium]